MRGTPTVYFKSLNRHFNVLGVDRQIFYLFVGICLPIAFSDHFGPIMDLVAVIVFIVLYVAGILMTRADNQILPLYRRHIHYKKYYSANSGVHAKTAWIRPSVPFYQGKRGLL